jgi:hypothetical protein
MIIIVSTPVESVVFTDDEDAARKYFSNAVAEFGYDFVLLTA